MFIFFYNILFDIIKVHKLQIHLNKCTIFCDFRVLVEIVVDKI